MSNQVNEAMLERKFILPQTVESSFTAAELSEDMDGLRLSFPRVKIPGGGALQFEIPSTDPDNPDYAKTLEGVILFNHAANTYWAEGEEYSDNNPPLCQSMDGKLGYGEPGGLCASCAYNAFGSSSKGAGKACKNMRVLYLLRSGDYMPIQLSLPPTSIRPFNDFVNQAFLLRRRGVCSAVVQIGLKKANNGTQDYSVATFKKLYDFEGEELNQIRAYADQFREQAKEMLSQRASETEAAAAEAVEVGAIPRSLPENEDHFAIGAGVINGEREPLPA